MGYATEHTILSAFLSFVSFVGGVAVGWVTAAKYLLP